jgi:tetratricopeptide (TPR) repeat protein
VTDELSHTTDVSRDPSSDDCALARAMSALNTKRFQDAAQIAAEVLRADQHHNGALRILGYALTMQGRAAEALAPLEAAAGSQDDPEGDTILAMALRQLGRHDDAIGRLKLAIARRPPYAAAFTELGYLLVSLDRYDEAIDVLLRGIEAAPTTPELTIQLGYAHLSQRDCTNAKIAFARALVIAPGSHDALFGLGKAHQEIGENEPAAACFRRYLTDRPSDAGAWLNLGQCLLELDQRDAGYECFRQAARGGATRYGRALTSLAAAARGRFWLRPSDAARFLRPTEP